MSVALHTSYETAIFLSAACSVSSMYLHVHFRIPSPGNLLATWKQATRTTQGLQTLVIRPSYDGSRQC